MTAQADILRKALGCFGVPLGAHSRRLLGRDDKLNYKPRS